MRQSTMLARFLPDPAKVQHFVNRLVLAYRFYRSTRTNGLIHQAEFDFVYLDGDRSPAVKRISGLFDHESDQPDALAPQAKSSPARFACGSHQRRALVLGRRDARLGRDRKADDELWLFLGIPSLVCEVPQAMRTLKEICRRAYDLAFDLNPGFVPAEALRPAMNPVNRE